MTPRSTGERQALDRLAAGAGIAATYSDAWGARRRVPAAAERALLAAMGFAIDSADEVRASLAALDERPWRRPLAPVVVARDGDPALRVPVVLPASGARRRLRWRLEVDGGAAAEGEVRAGDLAVEAARRLDGEARERRVLALPAAPGPGYYRLALAGGGLAEAEAGTTLIVAPAQCYLPDLLSEDGRAWGFAVQVYGLRSRRNWGMGDFTDLGALAEGAAGLGAGTVGVNPLHALFPARPAHASPYGPSSRLFLNVLYIDPEAVADFDACEVARDLVRTAAFEGALARLRKAPLVDYPGVAARKLEVLELLWRAFREHHLAPGRRGAASPRGRAFRRFQAGGGEALEKHAVFEALSGHLARESPGRGRWRDWPAAYRDPDSAEVRRFAADHRARVEFFQYLQWQADLQLGAAAMRGRKAGARLGLYLDLAVGADAAGSEAWAGQRLLASGATVGAPPDSFNLYGQNWGLPPTSPVALREAAYAPFAALLGANMRHAGALRVDHVLGWMRTFWIPEGGSPGDGAYVRYPFDELLAVAALESHRNHCLVVGEDLGTVPRGLRGRLRRARVLSCRLLYFERDRKGGFVPPRGYPELSLVAATTHDLPTLPGFWGGHDVALRAGCGLFPSPQAHAKAVRERARDLRLLLAALAREGLVPAGTGRPGSAVPPLSQDLVEAIYRYLARTPARLLMVQFEDLVGEVEQVNLPGTVDQHPNWRRKQRRDLDALASDPRVVRLAALLARAPSRDPGANRGGHGAGGAG